MVVKDSIQRDSANREPEIDNEKNRQFKGESQFEIQLRIGRAPVKYAYGTPDGQMEPHMGRQMEAPYELQ